MDIRTKLALALVTVALLSMFVIGSFAYRVSANLLQEISERQLDALAEAKKQDLLGLVEGWRNEVRLIRSRTQLRIRLRDYQAGDETALDDIHRILSDALESTEDVRRLTLFDRNNAVVATVGDSHTAPRLTPGLSDEEARYAGFSIDATPHLIFHSRVRLDDETIGGLEVVVAATNLEALANNYRGLGKTGETLVFAPQSSDNYVLLHTLRHEAGRAVWAKPPDYVRAAAAGVEQLFTDDVRDYRDEEVWVATRFLSDPGWGLVIKIDAEEETSRARMLRGQLIDLGLALGAFAVVGGTLLGFYLARPIRELAEVIERAHQGEVGVRANARSEDELGLLAETLNNYLDKYGPDQTAADIDEGPK